MKRLSRTVVQQAAGIHLSRAMTLQCPSPPNRDISLQCTSPYHSFNPESYMRFPQFLHDVNRKLTLYKKSQDCTEILKKGRLVYSSKCVMVEKEAVSTLESLSDSDRQDLRKLSVGCKGLFWQSHIDYTCVPCAFVLQSGPFSAAQFLEQIGLSSRNLANSTSCSFFAGGLLPQLPIVSYLGEDSMNVYQSPQEIITGILGKYDEVYHLTIGEGVINPVLQFIVADTGSGKLIGIMSASVVAE